MTQPYYGPKGHPVTPTDDADQASTPPTQSSASVLSGSDTASHSVFGSFGRDLPAECFGHMPTAFKVA